MMPLTLTAVLLTLSYSLPASAQTPESAHQHAHGITVIYDAGKTVDATHYYKRLTVQALQAERSFSSGPTIAVPTADIEGPVSLEQWFPLVSHTLRVGTPIHITAPHVYKPFFIIGMDSDSIAWMRRHYKTLAARQAQGVVVEASDWKKWLALKSEALREGITLSLLRGDGLAEMYNVSTYPVFVVGER
jgi:integrating conjugative element protein (TIGR03765 family)